MKIPQIDLCDIHTHILPGVDDGAKNIETAMRMIDIAYEDGIRVIAVTPHWHPVKCTLKYSDVLEKFEDFQRIVKENHPDMRLALGRELYYNSDIMDELEDEQPHTYNCSYYVLVEFPTNEEYSYIAAAMNRIIHAGYTPVIAHVERYQHIVGNMDRIRELRNMGVVIQVNAASVMGELGFGIKSFIKKMIKSNYVDVIASDAHSAGHRSPRLKECYEYVCRKSGADYAQRIFNSNPLKIIDGRNL